MVKKKNSMVGAVAVPVKRRGLWKTIWRYKWLYLMLGKRSIVGIPTSNSRS